MEKDLSLDIAPEAFYNHHWQHEWQDMERLHPTVRHLAKIIVGELKRVAPFESILDVGCGMGFLLGELGRHFPGTALTGVDLSDAIGQIAREHTGNNSQIHFHTLDISKARFVEEYDVVLCSQVLEHIKDDRAALQHMANMTRHWLFLTVPSGQFNSTSQIMGHYRHYSKGDLIEKVEATGLEIVFARQWGFPFHSLYKVILGTLDPKLQRKLGFGTYQLGKKAIAELLYWLFHANIIDRGDNILLLARRRSFARSGCVPPIMP